MITELENAVAGRIRKTRTAKAPKGNGLRGTPTTTPKGWTMGTKTGWHGAPTPPGQGARFKQILPPAPAAGAGSAPNLGAVSTGGFTGVPKGGPVKTGGGFIANAKMSAGAARMVANTRFGR